VRYGHFDLTTWFKDLDSHLSDKQKRIATEVIKEIKDRLNFDEV
jgi:excinuclease ABC subunit A